MLVEKIMKTGDYERITVADANGVVRAASDAKLVGQPYKPPAGERLGVRDKITAKHYMVNGQPMLGFDVPVTFQDQVAGRVALGIHEEPLTRVKNLSITLMAMLALVTVLAVAVAMYFVANWFAKPIKLVGESMGEVAKGRFDHRIAEHRKDEFGQLYAAFDDMAAALAEREAALDRSTPHAATPRPPGPRATGQVPAR